MNRIHPLPFASALTVTFLVLYAACAAAFTAFPNGTVDFFNAWFHGLDLNLLRPAGSRLLTLSQFIQGGVEVVVIAFPAGLILAGCYNLFARRLFSNVVGRLDAAR